MIQFAMQFTRFDKYKVVKLNKIVNSGKETLLL